MAAAGAEPLAAGDATAAASPRALDAPAAAPQSAEHAVLARYEAVLAALTPLSRASVVDRPALVDALAVPPARSAIMAAIAQADIAGEVFFGAPASRDPSVVIDGTTATVRDCQDTTGNGRKVRATGEIRAQGIARDPAVFTFELGADEIWRLATVSYPGGSC